MINLNEQILILIYSFLSGIIFGISFDVYKILMGNSKKILAFIKCMLFWVIVGISVFCFLLYTQYAILSFYTYFYIFLGAFIYLKFISKFLFNRVKKLIFSIKSFLRVVFKNIFYLILKIFTGKRSKSL